MVAFGHPRPSCLQHHLFFSEDHSFSQSERPDPQSKSCLAALPVPSSAFTQPALYAVQFLQIGHCLSTKLYASLHVFDFPGKLFSLAHMMREPQDAWESLYAHSAWQGGPTTTGGNVGIGSKMPQPASASGHPEHKGHWPITSSRALGHESGSPRKSRRADFWMCDLQVSLPGNPSSISHGTTQPSKDVFVVGVVVVFRSEEVVFACGDGGVMLCMSVITLCPGVVVFRKVVIARDAGIIVTVSVSDNAFGVVPDADSVLVSDAVCVVSVAVFVDVGYSDAVFVVAWDSEAVFVIVGGTEAVFVIVVDTEAVFVIVGDTVVVLVSLVAVLVG